MNTVPGLNFCFIQSIFYAKIEGLVIIGVIYNVKRIISTKTVIAHQPWFVQ